MIPEPYRSFEIHTLKDLVSYGDPLDEEQRTDGWGRGEEEASRHPPVPKRGRGHRRSAGPERRGWLRLGRRLLTRIQAR